MVVFPTLVLPLFLVVLLGALIRDTSSRNSTIAFIEACRGKYYGRRFHYTLNLIENQSKIAVVNFVSLVMSSFFCANRF